MKCTWPTPVFCVGTQRNLYSTDWHRGLASGKTQILALGNAKIYQHVGISNAKFWHRGHCPMPTPDARYFASQWNVGFTFKQLLLCYWGYTCGLSTLLEFIIDLHCHTYLRTLIIMGWEHTKEGQKFDYPSQ